MISMSSSWPRFGRTSTSMPRAANTSAATGESLSLIRTDVISFPERAGARRDNGTSGDRGALRPRGANGVRRPLESAALSAHTRCMHAPAPSPLPIDEAAFKARALLLGERLDLRGFKAADALATNPLTVRVPGGGVAVLYRYGVVVLFGVHSAEEVAFLTELRPFVIHPYPEPEVDEIEIRIEDEAREGLAGGVVLLAEADVPRLQVLADVLSKSVLLSLYERKVASEFDRIEPLAAELARDGRIPRDNKELLRMIGAMTLVEQRMVGRAEIADKPEVLWEH